MAAAAGVEACPALWMNPALHRTTPHAPKSPNRLHLVRALTRFCTLIGRAARSLHNLQGFTPWLRIKTVARLFLPACAALCESFSTLLPTFLSNTPAPPCVLVL